jgi:hypothetical protein
VEVIFCEVWTLKWVSLLLRNGLNFEPTSVVRVFTHDGEEWRAIVTGWSGLAGEYSIGVLFV